MVACENGIGWSISHSPALGVGRRVGALLLPTSALKEKKGNGRGT